MAGARLKPYLIDDGAVDGPVLVWAPQARSAVALAKRELSSSERDFWGQTIPNSWEAFATPIVLQGVEPPETPGFETRPDVLELASSQVPED